MFYFSIYWEYCIIIIMYNPNWRTHIFQRGRYTTNQSTYLNIKQFSHLCIACQLNISAAVSSGPSPPGPRFVPTKRPSWSHRHGAEVRPQRGEGRLPPAVRRRTGALLGAGAEGGTPGHVAQEGAVVKGGRWWLWWLSVKIWWDLDGFGIFDDLMDLGWQLDGEWWGIPLGISL